MIVGSTGFWRRTDFRVHHADWDGERILFHAGSGETHFLNAAAVALLDRLSESPASLNELRLMLADRQQAHETTGSPEEPLEALLTRLEELGLIVPNDPSGGR